MTKITKRQLLETGDTSAAAIDTVPHTYSASITLLSVTLTNAPPGDYNIDAGIACQPSGSGNCSVSTVVTGSTGNVSAAIIGVHGAGEIIAMVLGNGTA